jgi:hypothetical protein
MSEVYDLTVGGALALPSNQAPVVLEAEFDATKNPLAAGDDAKLIAIPAGTTVVSVSLSVETAEAAADTVDLGDGDGATQFLSNTATNALAVTLAASTTAKAYTAAGFIILHADAALSACKIRVTALVYRSGSPG